MRKSTATAKDKHTTGPSAIFQDADKLFTKYTRQPRQIKPDHVHYEAVLALRDAVSAAPQLSSRLYSAPIDNYIALLKRNLIGGTPIYVMCPCRDIFMFGWMVGQKMSIPMLVCCVLATSIELTSAVLVSQLPAIARGLVEFHTQCSLRDGQSYAAIYINACNKLKAAGMKIPSAALIDDYLD